MLATLIAIAVWEVLLVWAGVGLAILSGRVVGKWLVIIRAVWVVQGVDMLLRVGRGLVLWSALAGWVAGLVPALFRLLGPVWVSVVQLGQVVQLGPSQVPYLCDCSLVQAMGFLQTGYQHTSQQPHF